MRCRADGVCLKEMYVAHDQYYYTSNLITILQKDRPAADTGRR